MTSLDESELLATADQVREYLAAMSEALQLNGHEVTIIVTNRESPEHTVSHAILSTIDDHEELLETLDEVITDALEPYFESDDDDQPELPFPKVTLQ